MTRFVLMSFACRSKCSSTCGCFTLRGSGSCYQHEEHGAVEAQDARAAAQKFGGKICTLEPKVLHALPLDLRQVTEFIPGERTPQILLDAYFDAHRTTLDPDAHVANEAERRLGAELMRQDFGMGPGPSEEEEFSVGREYLRYAVERRGTISDQMAVACKDARREWFLVTVPLLHL